MINNAYDQQPIDLLEKIEFQINEKQEEVEKIIIAMGTVSAVAIVLFDLDPVYVTTTACALYMLWSYKFSRIDLHQELLEQKDAYLHIDIRVMMKSVAKMAMIVAMSGLICGAIKSDPVMFCQTAAGTSIGLIGGWYLFKPKGISIRIANS